MPMKTCPTCNKQSGPRTKKCECGFEFMPDQQTTMAVSANTEKMQLDPIEKRVGDAVGSIKSILSNAKTSPKNFASQPSAPEKLSPVETKPVLKALNSFVQGKIVAPAGPCPCIPKGYRRDWPEGPASDDVIQNWAVDVYNYGQNRYSWEAVVYWARAFWDINSTEYNRVRNLVITALAPQQSATDFDE